MLYPRYTREQSARCKVSDEDIEEIKKRRLLGETARSIAEDFGVSWSLIYYWGDPNKRNIKRKQPNKKRDKSFWDKYYERKESLCPEFIMWRREKDRKYSKIFYASKRNKEINK